MSLKKDILKMSKDIAEIKANLAPDTNNKLKKLEEMQEYLSHVKLNVKKITESIDEEGKRCLIILYDAPKVVLNFDDSGEALVNETFKAINGLDLISMNDKLLILENMRKKD